MIIYNGVSLNSVAPVKLEDIHVSPIQLNPVATQRPVHYGAEFVRMGGGTRNISVTFAILEQNSALRHEYLMAVSEWAKTDAEYLLEVPEDNVRGLWCVCTEKPDPSTRQWWESGLRLVFTCFDNPFWTSKFTKSVACGTQFVALGDAPPLMTIENTFGSSASNVAYSDGTDTMTFSTIPTGSMVIDLNRQTAAVGGSSIMGNYVPSGKFLVPKTGIQTITGTGTVKYRERWQ